jgi:hypothetical protein
MHGLAGQLAGPGARRSEEEKLGCIADAGAARMFSSRKASNLTHDNGLYHA